ncbi:MAG: hypothetical protein NC910_03360 [Candidatus Omnitrophica bacterium]|nr:hypothetical protein [Candidatus Omnitrophota bacterium]
MKRFAAIAAVAALVAAAVVADNRYPWLWSYVADQLPAGRPAEAVQGPTHVMFTFVDHFEPHDQQTMDRWLDAYPRMADAHQDADGRRPQHSWFWFFAQSDDAQKRSFLRQLASLSFDGYGEVELHLHHWADDEKSFLEKIGHAITLSKESGSFVTAEPEPKTAFGFIHGLWALDNSRQGACGVNNELILLKQVGCYADFTHPSWGKMHPRTVNRLFYAHDDPAKPKSYDSGTEMRVGGTAAGDLLIFEGPSVVRWKGIRPEYDHGDVTMEYQPTPERIDAWVRTGVHVKGRPEWVFVKVFTHGALAKDHEAVLGGWADRMHSYLEKKYNDGKNYVLHYVTAREAYNIAKAAEAGLDGNPHQYRDFVIPPYVNRYLIADVPFETLGVADGKIRVRFLAQAGASVTVRIKGSDGPVAFTLDENREKEFLLGTP